MVLLTNLLFEAYAAMDAATAVEKKPVPQQQPPSSGLGQVASPPRPKKPLPSANADGLIKAVVKLPAVQQLETQYSLKLADAIEAKIKGSMTKASVGKQFGHLGSLTIFKDSIKDHNLADTFPSEENLLARDPEAAKRFAKIVDDLIASNSVKNPDNLGIVLQDLGAHNVLSSKYIADTMAKLKAQQAKQLSEMIRRIVKSALL